MKKRIPFLLMLLFVFAAVPRPASASPEKAVGPLDVTYYFLPT
jgi:hypothetical protein